MPEPKMNFNNLPTESKGNSNVKAGLHALVINKATKGKTKEGKPMLALELGLVNGPDKFKTFDNFVLYDQNYEAEDFGQYKLRNLLTAVEWKPKKDFTMDILAEVLPGMKFKAKLEEEEYNGKTYLNIKDADSYISINEDKTLSDFAEEETEVIDEVDETVINELEDDDDIV